jgi:hypothetical protein
LHPEIKTGWRAYLFPLEIFVGGWRPTFWARRSPSVRELDSNPRDRDPLQAGDLNVGAFDVVDAKFQPYNPVCAVFLRLADQFLRCRKSIRWPPGDATIYSRSTTKN